MIRKLIQFAIIFLAVLSVLACEKLTGPSPTEVLNNYLDASLKGRYEESYSYVSAEDKATKDLQSYLKENEKDDNPFAQAIVSKVSYKILKLEKSEKKATADVEITIPDFGSIFADVMVAALSSAFGGEKSEAQMKKILAEKYANKDIPLTTTKENFTLLKESDGWKIFLDWETEKREKEKDINEKLAEAEKLIQEKKLNQALIIYDLLLERDSKDNKAIEGRKKVKEAIEIAEAKKKKVQSLLSEAAELKRKKKLHGALAKYNEILELDSQVVEAKEGVKKTETEINQFEEKQAYVKNVVLYDLSAKYHKTYLEERIPGVEFKLKNKGNRTLNKVEVTIYFKDAKGTIIAEEDYHPVLVTKYSFIGDNKPLKPNYVWQMERNHFYKAESVPTEWKEGAVSAKITNIEFAE